MDQSLSALRHAVDTFGGVAPLPIVIFVIALVLGVRPGRAFRAGLTVGIAFVGINLVFGLMLTSLDEVAQAVARNTGVRRDVVDVGWPSAAAIAFGSSVGLWVIPISILVNLLLLKMRLTRTLDVDIWNFWHFAFVGSLVTAATGALSYGLFAAALMSALSLLFADWTAKGVQRFYGVPGVSAPHLASAQIVPLAIILNWVMDRIPGFDRLHLDAEAIQKRLGIFGEPVVLGLVIGLVLGAVAFYNVGDAGMAVSKTLETGITLASAMLLLPRMVKILMEGLIPVSEAAQNVVQKQIGERDLYVGLDAAVLVGHPATIASSLVLVPIAILLSLVLPGNRVMIFADLAVIPFLVAMAAPIVNGNVLRLVIIGTVTLVAGFYIGTALAPLMTIAAKAANFAVPANTAGITSIVDGFLYIPFLVIEAVTSLGVFGLGLLGVVVLALLAGFRARPARREVLAGADPDDVAAAPPTRGLPVE